MTAGGFDRLRPRSAAAESMTAPAPTIADTEGKRALFSSAETVRPTGAGISVECARCGETTRLTAASALRLAFPAIHLSVVIDRAGSESTLGLVRGRRHGSWLRCPACGRGAWTRVTIRV
jgi:predicted RNA-binding Zn-ribbon protein involved in translation (DUF1610 family)